MNYGIPYQGSKNFLARRIVDLLPAGGKFYDLFAGGCAVLHAAMLSGKWRAFHANDTNGMPIRAFKDAIAGKFMDETRWISREEFFRLKDTDAYAAICFSFGNNLVTYAYNKNIERIKHAAHKAVFYLDTEELEAITGEDFGALKNYTDGRTRYLAYKKIIRKSSRRINLERLQSLESLERLQSLQSLERLERLQSLQITTGDYADVPIEEDSTVYCDIPYIGTASYKDADFDHERFYEWADTRQFPVFVSEYKMPDAFVPIWQRKHTSRLCSKKAFTVTEKVFVQRRYAGEFACDLFGFQ